MTTRRSVTLTLLVDLKVGDNGDIKNIIERLECSCKDMSGEDVEVTGIKILDRKILIEADIEE